MLHPRQIAAARALLDWSRGDLSAKSDVSPRTIARFESGEGDITVSKLERIETALTEAGVRFVEGGVVLDRLLARRESPSR